MTRIKRKLRQPRVTTRTKRAKLTEDNDDIIYYSDTSDITSDTALEAMSETVSKTVSKTMLQGDQYTDSIDEEFEPPSLPKVKMITDAPDDGYFSTSTETLSEEESVEENSEAIDEEVDQEVDEEVDDEEAMFADSIDVGSIESVVHRAIMLKSFPHGTDDIYYREYKNAQGEDKDMDPNQGIKAFSSSPYYDLTALTDEERAKFHETTAYIREHTPTLNKILKAPLPTGDRARVLRLYHAFLLEELDSPQRLVLGERINWLLKDPITSEVIEGARLLPQEKQYLQFLFEIYRNTYMESESWYQIRLKIIEILDKRYPEDTNMETLYFQCASISDPSVTLGDVVQAPLSEHDKGSAIADYLRNLYDTNINNIADTYKHNRDFIRNRALNIIQPVVSTICERIVALRTTDDIKNVLRCLYKKSLSEKNADDKLGDKLEQYLRLPYGKLSDSHVDSGDSGAIQKYCQTAYEYLDKHLYGMEEVKFQVMQIINNRCYNPGSRSILTLKGAPGVGKTKLAKSIAEAMRRSFHKISLGGQSDTTMLTGSNGVWQGSTPSAILDILMRSHCCDPVILFDELDKTADNSKNIDNVLLHILDPAQNNNFQDNYLSDIPHDISNIWFIIAINDDKHLKSALRDRLNIVTVPSYTQDDMKQIIMRHTLPDMLVDKGFKRNDVTITPEACARLLIKLDVGRCGLRVVERAIDSIVSYLNLSRTFVNDIPHQKLKYNKEITFPFVIKTDFIEFLPLTRGESKQPFYIH